MTRRGINFVSIFDSMSRGGEIGKRKRLYARVMELVDIADLSSAASNGVWVRVPLRVPFYLVF